MGIKHVYRVSNVIGINTENKTSLYYKIEIGCPVCDMYEIQDATAI